MTQDAVYGDLGMYRKLDQLIVDTSEGGDIMVDGVSLIDEVKALSGLDSGELGVLNGVTAGTVTASKAVVVDANKDIGDFRNVDVVNLDAGSSGVGGTVDVFPATASKGKTVITAADNVGDTTTIVTTAAQAGARTYTIRDTGAATGAFALGAQQVHVADAKINYTTGDLDIEAEVIAAFNTTNGKINSILTALEAFGIHAAV
mgnify:CR=1 FL=1